MSALRKADVQQHAHQLGRKSTGICIIGIDSSADHPFEVRPSDVRSTPFDFLQCELTENCRRQKSNYAPTSTPAPPKDVPVESPKEIAA